MSLKKRILDGILDSVSSLSPTLGEMRWNQLQREYDKEVELEKKQKRNPWQYEDDKDE